MVECLLLKNGDRSLRDPRPRRPESGCYVRGVAAKLAWLVGEGLGSKYALSLRRAGALQDGPRSSSNSLASYLLRMAMLPSGEVITLQIADGQARVS